MSEIYLQASDIPTEYYGLIYIIKCRITNKLYIGQTISNFNVRIRSHISRAKHNARPNSHLHNAINKYGWNNFESFILGYVTTNQQDLDLAEMECIEFFDSFRNGYNKTLGGNTSIGHKHTESSKQKIRENRVGKTIGERNGMFGRGHSQEAIAKMLNNRRPQKGVANGMFGKNQRNETKRKMSENRTNIYLMQLYAPELVEVLRVVYNRMSSLRTRKKKHGLDVYRGE